jgi:putative heme-binding domain-containing protein
VQAVIGYVRSLQGAVDSRTFPGDARRGEAIFFGKGQCSSCHVISGKGGFIGPDLSTYGSKISANAIREGIVDTKRVVPQGYKLATALTADGHSVEGIVRNEDNFSIQLLTLDGNFHFFNRNNLQKLEYAGRSLMPDNYGERLSRNELDDLVSFLMNPGSSGKKQQTPETKEDDAE